MDLIEVKPKVDRDDNVEVLGIVFHLNIGDRTDGDASDFHGGANAKPLDRLAKIGHHILLLGKKLTGAEDHHADDDEHYSAQHECADHRWIGALAHASPRVRKL